MGRGMRYGAKGGSRTVGLGVPSYRRAIEEALDPTRKPGPVRVLSKEDIRKLLEDEQVALPAAFRMLPDKDGRWR